MGYQGLLDKYWHSIFKNWQLQLFKFERLTLGVFLLRYVGAADNSVVIQIFCRHLAVCIPTFDTLHLYFDILCHRLLCMQLATPNHEQITITVVYYRSRCTFSSVSILTQIRFSIFTWWSRAPKFWKLSFNKQGMTLNLWWSHLFTVWIVWHQCQLAPLLWGIFLSYNYLLGIECSE